jgi:DNA-binding GntR family transcriptional regulator
MSAEVPPRLVGVARVREGLADEVYRLILESMLHGNLKAGDRLVMDRLADEFDVSRTPVREALQRLHNEGAIEPTGRRGYVVRATSEHDVSQLYESRYAIEGHAAALLAGDTQRLEPVYAVLERVTSEPIETPEASFQANRSIHRAVVQGLDNDLLLRFFDTIWGRAVAGLMFYDFFAARPYDTLAEEHKALLDTLSSEGPEQARVAMIEHIAAGRARTPAGEATAAESASQ